MKPRLYDLDMKLISILRYASKIGYTHKFNDLWTASFLLPVDDDTNDLCEANTIIDIFDGNKSIGKYRILEEPEAEITAEDGFVEYSCEHVIAFLLNDVIDGYLELGGEETDTRQVIEALLALQTVKRWRLGRCDYNYKFQHSWENTNLLDALFSVPKCFSDKYHWEFDTDSYPWTINLVRLNAEPSCIIHRKRNCQYIKRAKDNSQLTTRLYCKGSGEGVNQLTIAEVNPNGKPYIDSDTIGAYGIRASHYIDLTCTDAETLYAKGKQILEEVKHPRYTYSAKAAHLSKMTGDDWYHYEEGRCVRMLDGNKIDIQTIIIEVSKSDVEGNPLDIDIVLSNKDSDVASAIDDLARRTAITAQYSQGATNLYAQQFADNADEDHPAIMKVYVPQDCAQINSMMLSWSVEKFRAYSRGASAGGEASTTSSAGGGIALSENIKFVTTDVLVWACTEKTGASNSFQTGNSSLLDTDSAGSALATGEAGDHTHNGPSHAHSFSASQSLANNHTHNIANPGESTVTGLANQNSTHSVEMSGTTGYAGTGDTSSAGAHRHSMAEHSHGMQHTHSVPGHTHDMDHSHDVLVTIEADPIEVNVESHEHTVVLPSHYHGINYGIYEGSKAESVTIMVDETEIPVEELANKEMDIVKYLSKDSNGKIRRGAWHTITISPDKMSRIEANLFVQTFVTSHSGGSY